MTFTIERPMTRRPALHAAEAVAAGGLFILIGFVLPPAGILAGVLLVRHRHRACPVSVTPPW